MTEPGSRSQCDKEECRGEFRIASTYHVYMYPDTPYHRHPDLFESERNKANGSLTVTDFNDHFMNNAYEKKPLASETDWLNEQIRMYTSKRFSLVSPILRSRKYSSLLSDAEMDKIEASLRCSKRIAEKYLAMNF